MKTCKKIEEVDAPTVGKFYLVPGVMDRSYRWWPVIGNWHEDADIGTASYHFHHDVRFFAESQMDYDGGYNLARIRPHPGKPFGVGTVADKNNPPPVIYKRRKMRREMPEFPNRDRSFKKPSLLVILEKQFEHVKMSCMTCPHRGMRLKGLPTKDGTVVCNGHGLKWDLATGKMIAR